MAVPRLPGATNVQWRAPQRRMCRAEPPSMTGSPIGEQIGVDAVRDGDTRRNPAEIVVVDQAGRDQIPARARVLEVADLVRVSSVSTLMMGRPRR